MVNVYGDLIDKETRCIHYHSALDIIALKCFACRRYYPCFACHDTCERHTYVPYPMSRSADKVVLCGGCRSELTIAQYLNSAAACPVCSRSFNPGCKAHAAIYFQADSRFE
ncbi:CHY zinc finger protein [Streptococcus sp. DD11]|uniref:CHY zinc finger protein n=1 Tax=Streptococcus sp. DD11 TaxID=1777879 RepID=UPI000B181423|nr:CHY zinc finger protein [Streptococcus sp. DD11]